MYSVNICKSCKCEQHHALATDTSKCVSKLQTLSRSRKIMLFLWYSKTHTILVWCIYLQLVDFYGKMLWELFFFPGPNHCTTPPIGSSITTGIIFMIKLHHASMNFHSTQQKLTWKQRSGQILR